MAYIDRNSIRVFGSETEFGIHAETADGFPVTATSKEIEYYRNKSNFYEKKPLSSLPDIHKENFDGYLRQTTQLYQNPKKGFLSSGARAYIDVGLFEYATPEVRTPEELVTYELAGEEFVVDAMRHLVDEGVISQFQVNKKSTDLSHNSWGYHENIFLNSMPTESQADEILSFNATRAILTGSGGLLRRRADKSTIRYSISPRLTLTDIEISAGRLSKKPLYCESETPENEGFRIQQVMGEASNSPWSIRMRHGLNSAFFSSLEAGIDFEDLILENPLVAAHDTAGQLMANAKITLRDGTKITALEWQKRFAERALANEAQEQYLSEDELWALGQSIEAIDQMEKDIFSVGDRVEWIARIAFIGFEMGKSYPEKSSIDMITRDTRWDIVGTQDVTHVGQAQILRSNGWGWHGFDRIPTSADIIAAKYDPPKDTRAIVRARFIEENNIHNRSGEYYVEEWDRIVVNGMPFTLPVYSTSIEEKVLRIVS